MMDTLLGYINALFFELACGSFCVPLLRRSLCLCAGMCVFEHSLLRPSFFLCAGVWVFLRSVVAKVLVSLCWHGGL